MIPHCDDQDLLLYHHGALPLLQRWHVAWHVRRCPRCQDRGTALSAVSGLMAGAVRGRDLPPWSGPAATVPTSPALLSLLHRPLRPATATLLILLFGAGTVAATITATEPSSRLRRLLGAAPMPDTLDPAGGICQSDNEAAAAAPLKALVAQQVQAIRAGDYVAALRFASPAFRRRHSPDGLRRTVATGYPQMAAPSAAVIYGPARHKSPDKATLAVRFAAPNNAAAAVSYVYHLVRVGGTWTVDAVLGGSDDCPF